MKAWASKEQRGSIVQVFNKFGLREIARTGKIALPCESGVNTEFLKSLEAKV